MRGKVLGKRYEIVEEIGAGGMAVVYKAKDLLLNRTVAVKVLREQYAGDEEFIRRFRREAQAVASLSHPNIVSIYDVGEEDRRHYLVMEYVPGSTLKQLIKEKAPLSEEHFLYIAVQICDALEHAHENGVIHRDIKPHNILLTPNGRVKVTDFGIARAASNSTVTYNGSMVGSVYYISPEQARGQVTTAASDIYSAAIVFYEMLTGKVPFSGEGPIAVAMQHIDTSPEPLSAFNPQISPGIERVILKAMKKQPEERFETAAQFKNALEMGRWESENEITKEMEPVKGVMGEERKISKRKRRRLKPLAWVLVILILAGMAYAGVKFLESYFIVADVKVPDVTDTPLLEAEQQLRLAGLKPAVGEEKNSSEIKKGNVLKQRPAGGEIIKKNRIVFLDISLGPQMVEVPAVTGDTERAATLKLENRGLTVAADSARVIHPEQPAGTVIDQDPPAQTLVPQGSAVRLVISKGPEPQYIPMPDLVGLTLPEATNILGNNRLELGLAAPQESDLYFSGQVASQDIAAGADVLQGTKVNLVVSSGPGPKPVNLNVRNIWVPDDGQQHLVRVMVEDVKGTREEYNQMHNSGEKIETTVTIYGKGKIKIFIDDELINEQQYPRE